MSLCLGKAHERATQADPPPPPSGGQKWRLPRGESPKWGHSRVHKFYLSIIKCKIWCRVWIHWKKCKKLTSKSYRLKIFTHSKKSQKTTFFSHFFVNVRLYLNHFYIEKGLHSRTEIGGREINGSTVHNMGAVGNRILFSCLPLPPPPHDLVRGTT